MSSSIDRGTRLILTELRDLRVDMRADRQRSDERFERMFREFREDSARRDAAMQNAMQKTFRDFRTEVRSVGLAIVRAVNRNTRLLEQHGRLLERIDRNLGARRNGPPR